MNALNALDVPKVTTKVPISHRPAKSTAKQPDVDKRVATLEARVSALEKALSETRKQLETMERLITTPHRGRSNAGAKYIPSIK